MRARLIPLATVALLVVAAPSPAVTPATLLRCQKAIHLRATTFVKLVQTGLANCAFKVEACQLAQEIDGEDPTSCLASATSACGAYSAKIPVYKSSAIDKGIAACGAIPLDELERYVAGLGFASIDPGCVVGSVSDLVTCLLDGAQCTAERTLFALDPRAADALAAAGIAGAHPCVQ
jgi:hypothetical protein